MNIEKILNNKIKPKILIIGDIILDTFVLGKYLGKSPEGPIPLIKKNREYSTAGAAALVAKCVNKIGGNSFLIGGFGSDVSGKELNYQIKRDKINHYIVINNRAITTNKTRVFSDYKPLIRLDSEQEFKISKKEKKKIKKKNNTKN